jgi:hypothetical protein
MKLPLTLAITLTTISHGIVFKDESAFDPNRFLNFSTVPTANPNFEFRDFDLSAVGWINDKAVTLISPKYILYAAHFRNGAGTTVSFMSPTGVLVTSEILINHPALIAISGSVSDLQLAELKTPITFDLGITPMAYFDNPTNIPDAEYYHQNNQLLIGGAKQRFGTAVGDFAGNSPLDPGGNGRGNGSGYLWGVFTDERNSATTATTVGGDSGGPTMAIIGGQLALTGIHYSAVSGTYRGEPFRQTDDSFVPHQPFIDQINAVMAKDGYSMMKFSDSIPEPKPSLILSITAIVLFVFYRKRP